MPYATATPLARFFLALPFSRAGRQSWSRWFGELFSSESERDRRTASALAILQSDRSSLDMRDWAERYLCGLVDMDANAYLATRRSQS